MGGWKWVIAGVLYAAFAGVLFCTTETKAAAEAKAAKDAREAAKVDEAAAKAAAADDTDQSKAVARRSIPKGGLILAASLDKATAVDLRVLPGTYARSALHSGDRVRTRDVLRTPPLPTTPGVLWVGLPVALEEAETGRIDVDVRGTICTARGSIGEAEVGAVACADVKAAYCTALLRVEASGLETARGWVQAGARVASKCT